MCSLWQWLENATRICEAKFGTLFLYENDVMRAVALHNAPPPYAEARRREPEQRPQPGSSLARIISTRRVVHIPDIDLGARLRLAAQSAHWRSNASDGADAQRGGLGRSNWHLPARGTAVHREADRASPKLCQPSRHKLKAYSVGEIEPIAGATLSPSYLDNIRKEINKAHGRSLRTLSGKIFHIEGAPAPTKLAIVEWDSADDAKAFYNSKVWTDLKPERDKAQKTVRRYIVEVEP